MKPKLKIREDGAIVKTIRKNSRDVVGEYVGYVKRGKKHMFWGLTCLMLCAMFTGCANTSPQTINAIAAGTRVASKRATFLVVRNNPQLRPDFEHARDSLTVICEAKDLNFGLAVEVVSKFPIAALSDPDVKMLVQDGQQVLNLLNVNYPLNKVENLRPIVISARDGIDDGLALLPK